MITRCIILFHLIVLIGSLKAQENVALNNLRTIFLKSSYDKELLPEVEVALNNYKPLNAVKLAYQGATKALHARLTWNPFEQISILKEGLTLMDKAVEMEPDNIEVHFIRFSVLHYVPAILGLSENLEPDRQFILSHISQLTSLKMNNYFADHIYKFCQKTERFTEAELVIINKAILKSNTTASQENY